MLPPPHSAFKQVMSSRRCRGASQGTGIPPTGAAKPARTSASMRLSAFRLFHLASADWKTSGRDRPWSQAGKNQGRRGP